MLACRLSSLSYHQSGEEWRKCLCSWTPLLCMAGLRREGSACLCCIEIQREQIGKFLQHLEEIELSQNTEMDFSGKRYILLKARLEKIKMVKMCLQHAPAVLQSTIYFCFPVVSYCRCTGMPAFSYPVFNIIYLILSHYFFILVPGNALTAGLIFPPCYRKTIFNLLCKY